MKPPYQRWTFFSHLLPPHDPFPWVLRARNLFFAGLCESVGACRHQIATGDSVLF